MNASSPIRARDMIYNLIHAQQLENYLSRFARVSIADIEALLFGVRARAADSNIHTWFADIAPFYLLSLSHTVIIKTAHHSEVFVHTNTHVHGFQHRAAQASCFLRATPLYMCWWHRATNALKGC